MNAAHVVVKVICPTRDAWSFAYAVAAIAVTSGRVTANLLPHVGKRLS